MQIQVAHEIPKSQELRAAWNELALGMEKPEIFYTYEWAIAIESSYKESLKPLVFLAYKGQKLAGVVALARQSSGDVVFLTADTGDYCEFLTEPKMRSEFVDVALSELRKLGVARLILTNLPAESPTASAIVSAARQSGYHAHIRPAYDCARVVMGSLEERQKLEQAVQAKKRLRRNIRELKKRGSVEIVHETSWPEIAPRLAPFFRAHVARFFETGKVSNLVREERRAFLVELAKNLSYSGWVTMSRLRVGDVTAAWNYGFRFGGSWFWYQPTVNRIYGDFSPGYCLLAKIVEESCNSPEIDVVDMGLGAEGYKERFATSIRQTLYCELNASHRSHAATIVRHHAASVATASPWIEKRIRHTIDGMKVLQSDLKSGTGAALRKVTRRLRSILYSRERVLFFAWQGCAETSRSSSRSLLALDSDLLGTAGIEYGDDPAAIRFLVRSAQRLDAGDSARGFVLLEENGIPLHFGWVRNFEGFSMAELDRTLHAPCENAVLIFDCFTPARVRGHGYFAEAIVLLAARLHAEGKSVWIFGAERNELSLRSIRKTAFEYRFTLGRMYFLFGRFKDDPAPMDARAHLQSVVIPSEQRKLHS